MNRIPDKFAFWRWPRIIDRLTTELKELRDEHAKVLAGQSKLLDWVKTTHRLDSPAEGIRALIQNGKRLVPLLVLLLGVQMAVAQAPPVLRQPLTTNSHFGPVPTEGQVPIWNATANKWSNNIPSSGGGVAFADLVWTNKSGTLLPIAFPTNILFRVVAPDDGVATNFYFDSRTFRTNAATKLFAIYNGGSNAVTVGPNGGLFMGRGNQTPFPGVVLYGIYDTSIGESNQQEIFIQSKSSAVGYNGSADIIVDTNYGAFVLTAVNAGATRFSRFAIQAGGGIDPEKFNNFNMQALVDGATYFQIDPSFTLLTPTNYLFSSSVRVTNTHTLMSLQNSNTPVLEVDGVGDLRMIKRVPYLWPAAQGAAATVLTNNGSGVLGWGTVASGGSGTPHIWTNDGFMIMPYGAYTNHSPIYIRASDASVFRGTNVNLSVDINEPSIYYDAFQSYILSNQPSTFERRAAISDSAPIGTFESSVEEEVFADKDVPYSYTFWNAINTNGISHSFFLQVDPAGIGGGSGMSLVTNGVTVFLVNSSGDIGTIKAINYSWPSTQGAASTTLTNDGAGNLGWGTVASGTGGGDTIWTNDVGKIYTMVDRPRIEFTTNRIFGRLIRADGTNTALGSNAMPADILAESSVAIGTDALGFVGAGQGSLENVAIGSSSSASNSGSFNVSIGFESMRYNRFRSDNVAIGYRSLNIFDTGNQNTAVGGGTMDLLDTSFSGTALGWGALDKLEGSGNTALGSQALLNAQGGGNYNVAVGYESMEASDRLEGNVAIGRGAFTGIDDLTNTVAIGYQATSLAGGLTNAVGIGALTRITADNQMMLGTNIINYVFRNVGYNFPSAQGSAATVLTNDGSGNLGWGAVSGSGGVAFSDLVWTNNGTQILPNAFPTNVLLRVDTPDDGVGTNFYWDARTYRANSASKLLRINNGGSNAITVGPFGGLFIGRNNGTPSSSYAMNAVRDTSLGEPANTYIQARAGNAAGYFSSTIFGNNTNFFSMTLRSFDGATRHAIFDVTSEGYTNAVLKLVNQQSTTRGVVLSPGTGISNPSYPTNYLFNTFWEVTNLHTILSLQNSNTPVFEVDGIGDLKLLKRVAYSWPDAQGSAQSVLTNDGSGNLGWFVQPLFQPASANLTNWSNIPTGAMANVVSSTFHTNWVNAVSNLVNTKQFGSATLTNLSGTGAITNLFSLSLSNASIKPIVFGGVGNAAGMTNLTGQLYGLEAGANVVLTPNGSNISVAATLSGGGYATNANQFGAQVTLTLKDGIFLTNIIAYPTGSGTAPALTVTNIPGIGTNSFQVLNTNGVPVIYGLTNNGITLVASNVNFLGPQTNTASLNVLGGVTNWASVETRGSVTNASRVDTTGGVTNWAAEETKGTLYASSNLLVKAGQSTSNAWVGGRIFMDAVTATTNHTGTANYTNLFTYTVPGNALTNTGDEIEFYLSGQMRRITATTNGFKCIYGTSTIFDTGFITASNCPWSATIKITRTGLSSQRVEAKILWNVNLAVGSGGNGTLSTYATNMPLAQVNGDTNIFVLQGQSRLPAAITNDYRAITWTPGLN